MPEGVVDRVRARLLSLSIIAGAFVALTVATVSAQSRILATVSGVVDGDTIRVRLDSGDAVTVRLIGIDTPETKHPTRPVQCFGAEASAKTAALLPVGTRVDLEMDVQPYDRYGRTLAYVWRDGGAMMVNQELAAEGYALQLTIPPNVRYAEQFSAAVQVARENRLGLWSACVGTPMEISDDAPSEDQAPASQPAGGAPASKPQPAPKRPGAGDMNCTDFRSQAEAQAALRADPSDPWDLDRDGDGIACETRPGPRDLVRVP